MLEALVTKPRNALETPQASKSPWSFPYRFLPEISAKEGQIGHSSSTKRLKLSKTLQLTDTICGGKWLQENPPPGTMGQRCCQVKRHLDALGLTTTGVESAPVRQRSNLGASRVH